MDPYTCSENDDHDGPGSAVPADRTDDAQDARDDVAAPVLDEDAQEVIDVVLLWFRDGDGDLIDTLVDARTPLSDEGFVWVLTPKTGRDGHIQPSEIAEAAPTAGLSQTSNATLGDDWVGSKLVPPKQGKGKR